MMIANVNFCRHPKSADHELNTACRHSTCDTIVCPRHLTCTPDYDRVAATPCEIYADPCAQECIRNPQSSFTTTRVANPTSCTL